MAMSQEGVRYLHLLSRVLLGLIMEDRPMDPWSPPEFNLDRRLSGEDWPSRAFTMIGQPRLVNIQTLLETAVLNNIPGDFLEAGVWRGGACIYARAVLDCLGQSERKVWVADSFQGLPPPQVDRYPVDAGDIHHTYKQLAVSLEQVMANFYTFDLLSDQVKFLPGWFHETLPSAPVGSLAVLRVDCDMFSSTYDVLTALYDKVSPGGYIIVDDYGAIRSCKLAVMRFWQERSLQPEIVAIDKQGIYWRKPVKE